MIDYLFQLDNKYMTKGIFLVFFLNNIQCLIKSFSKWNTQKWYLWGSIKSLNWGHLYSFFGVGLVAKLCPTLCDPMDCSPPGSSVHGIFQARILEWVDISFSRGIFPTQGLNLGLLHCRQSPAQSKHCRQSPVQFQLSPAQVKNLIS